MLPLLSYDPFYRRSLMPTVAVGNILSPFRQLERELDSFFDGIQPMLRDHAAQFSVSDKGELFYKVTAVGFLIPTESCLVELPKFQVDVSGFHPQEIGVEVVGNEIVVSGEHREQNANESVHRQFTRRVLIPEGIQKESIKCELDNGRLCISGMKTAGEGGRTITIETKKKGTPVEGQKQKQ